ncbi:carbamoyltransferase C-terminal domain-containing protein [Oceanobacillus profundus]|uniref:carbamoyltransferase family protein n=1 Tax=Oceanobacillus TaxID=182709 RepID=UPI0026E2829C|nr:carbamoyltransferase C-terminal domain-containing protein [Oceanobacillus profundus]MDO6450014.1 carbamoyltransferase C-terminal domain-containing protein [Oceanobacillus profundus]
MKILGLGGSGHSFSACIIENGKIISAIEEERLNRIKHSLFTRDTSNIKLARNKAANYCLQSSGYHINEIDIITSNDIIDPRYTAKFHDKTIFFNHHLTHASSAYFTSPFKDAAILVVDGNGSYFGENNNKYETITLYTGKENKIHKLSSTYGTTDTNESFEFHPHNSIGGFYRAVTEGIGFHFLQDGKTMGLSSYGCEKYVKLFYKFYHLDKGYFLQSRSDLNRLKNFIKEELATTDQPLQTKADFAFAVQYHTEEILIKLACRLYEQTRSPNLCFSGGVALNSVANTRLLNETPFENIYIFPVSSDSGCSIGSALYLYYSKLGNIWEPAKTPFSPFLGKEYSKDDIQHAIKLFQDQISVNYTEDIDQITSRKLSEGNIVGWFQGRSEIGPRALGNRSILADPRQIKNRYKLNLLIKKREVFRPFAPAVMAEYQDQYFDSNVHSPYMLNVFPIKKEKVNQLPAVSHVDKTARVQTVIKSIHPKFYNLLNSFYSITQIPVLLNTSFNTNGQPIIETPAEAIKSFLELNLDYLVIDKFVIKKRERRD